MPGRPNIQRPPVGILREFSGHAKAGFQPGPVAGPLQGDWFIDLSSSLSRSIFTRGPRIALLQDLRSQRSSSSALTPASPPPASPARFLRHPLRMPPSGHPFQPIRSSNPVQSNPIQSGSHEFTLGTVLVSSYPSLFGSWNLRPVVAAHLAVLSFGSRGFDNCSRL